MASCLRLHLSSTHRGGPAADNLGSPLPSVAGRSPEKPVLGPWWEAGLIWWACCKLGRISLRTTWYFNVLGRQDTWMHPQWVARQSTFMYHNLAGLALCAGNYSPVGIKVIDRQMPTPIDIFSDAFHEPTWVKHVKDGINVVGICVYFLFEAI